MPFPKPDPKEMSYWKRLKKGKRNQYGQQWEKRIKVPGAKLPKAMQLHLLPSMGIRWAPEAQHCVYRGTGSCAAWKKANSLPNMGTQHINTYEPS